MMKKYHILVLLILSSLSFAYSQTGDKLFDGSMVHEIKLNSTNSSIVKDLMNKHSNYLFSEGTKTYYEVQISIDGTILADSVGLRMKGETSFTETPGEKKPFKIDINKFSVDQEYDGLKKFNLHNAQADASMLRDKLSYDLFREMGMNAPRVSFAKVYLNDEYWGVYSVVEQVDKTYLKENFGNKDGNLYKSLSSGAVNFENMELKTNEIENDFSNLDLLKDKIENTTDVMFEDTLRKYLNVDAYITSLAIDVLILDVDKYWQVGKNFYLYDNTSTGKFEWIPWDYNLAMNYFFDGFNYDPNYKEFVDNNFFESKTLIRRIMANENLKNQYLRNLCMLKEYFNTTTLYDKIDKLKTLIEADVLLDTKKPYSNSEFQGNIETSDYFDFSLPNAVPGIKQFILDRSAFLDDYLSSIEYSCTLAGITNGIENKFNIYPNPVNRGHKIYISGIEKPVPFYLYNMQGQMVYAKVISESEVLIPNQLNKGIYFYKTLGAKGKIIIE
jgi:spore coat protein CotH